MIIFRYLFKEVFITVIGVTGVLLLIFMSHQFVHFLAAAAAGKYPGMVVLKLVILAMPQLLGLLLPLGLFLGLLLAYGRLYADHEMTVLNACGISQSQILRMSLFMALIVSLFVGFQTLWLSPKLYAKKQQILARAEATSMVETLIPGRFQASDDGQRVYYVESISKGGKKIHNVFMASSPEGGGRELDKRWDVLSAEHGYQMIDAKSKDRFIVASNGYRYVGKPGEREFEIVKFGKYGVRVEEHDAKFSRKEHAIPTVELLKSYAETNMAAELQWRLSLPISVLVLAFLAVPLSEVKPRHGKYARLFPALLIYIVYANLIIVSQDWVETGSVSIGVGMWWGHALFALLGWFLFRRYKRL